MDNSIKIGKYMKLILQADEELMSMVPINKINGLWIGPDTTYPYIVYSRSAINTQYNKDLNGCLGHVDTVQVTVDCHGNSYEQSCDVACAFRNALEGKGYNAEDMFIDRFQLISANETTDGLDDYCQTLVFQTTTKTK